MKPAVTDSKETAVSSGMKGQLRQERQRAIAGLLRQPLLQSMGAGGDLLPLVRRHQIWLRDWFSRHCGWTLQVDSDFARLRKAPPDGTDATRPLPDSNQQPFTRRRYVLLCLALAVLEKSERQTVLNKLAEEIASRFSLDTQLLSLGFTFDVSIRDHRRDLIEVIRYLLGLNVLSKVDGDEQQYLSSGRDVLYNINLAALAVIPNFRRGPSTITAADITSRLEALLDEPYPDTEEGRNRRLRTNLFRRLLDDPLIYYADLDEHESAYLVSQRPSIAREIEAATSLLQEARREGLAMVDPDDEMIDIGMPEEGTDGHVTLLVAEYLASRLRAGAAAAMPVSEIESHVESLIPLHKAYWRKSVTDAGAAQLLAADALTRLEKLRLIARDISVNTVKPLPAIGRFALGTVKVETPNDAGIWGN
jgi:uncharacterized protein (TIGR02678 family)